MCCMLTLPLDMASGLVPYEVVGYEGLFDGLLGHWVSPSWSPIKPML